MSCRFLGDVLGYSSLGGGTVVQFPRIWMSSGECRLNYSTGDLTAVGTTINDVVSVHGGCIGVSRQERAWKARIH